uniref:Uncharacterized protein n=1 Tax=Solanum tuberosum TaxID=4113 RepID=M1DSS1_SOLTU
MLNGDWIVSWSVTLEVNSINRMMALMTVTSCIRKQTEQADFQKLQVQPTDRRVTHGQSWWFADGHLQPPQNPSSEVDRWTDRTDRGLVHGSSISLFSVSISRIDRFPDLQLSNISGIWIEEQSKDTNRQTGTKQAEEIKMEEPEDRQEHSACHRVSYQTA